MATLLLIEDDPTLAAGMGELFMSAGHQVEMAISGSSARTILDRLTPDLIVSDIVMPGMTGPALLRAVRSQPRLASIPFIFVSASSTPDEEAYIASQERVYFVRKPFDVGEFLGLLDAVLESHS
jgi:twitching motility two-component system response regulator PilH